MTGRKGNIQAKKFLQELGLSHPLDLSLEDIAISQGAFIKNDNLEGCDGRIVLDDDEAIITVSNTISYKPKQRFVVAHELGHFRMHKNTSPAFIDDEKTLYEWFAKGIHELEANCFASELLMPENLFIPILKGQKFDMNLIYELADEFETSITATLLRYQDLGDYPMALILVKNGVIEWRQFTDDFPLQFIRKGSEVSPFTIVGDHVISGNPLEKSPDLTKAIEWFPEDFNVKKFQSWSFYEQCVYVSKGTILVCLWTF